MHVFDTTFGGSGSGAGQFERPIGVAVNSTTHDLYVADSGNNRVEEFSSTGAYIREFNGSGVNSWEIEKAPTGQFIKPTQIAVDNSTNPTDPSAGDVYVVDFGHDVIDKFSASGAYLGQLTGTTCSTPSEPEKEFLCPTIGTINAFERLAGVAVASSGSLWVMEVEGNIDSFDDSQQNLPISIRRTVAGGSIHEGLAVDDEGNLYMNPREIAKVATSGTLLIPVFDPFEEPAGVVVTALGVAVDGVGREVTGGEVYIDNFESIGRADVDGKSLERFGQGDLTESVGLAVDSGSGTVYASNRGANNVAIFSAVTLPTVTLTEPSDQTPRSLTLNGTVDPEGELVTSCRFEYGSKSVNEHTAPCTPSPGNASTPVAVEAHLKGLTPEQKYSYRLVAENLGGSSEAGGEFAPGPGISEVFVAEVTSTSAALHAGVDPNGADTHYYIEYGTTEAYGSFAPVAPPGVDLGESRGAQQVSPTVVGLEPGNVYHYRVVASQDGEVFDGQDMTFTTQPVSTTGEGQSLDGRGWELVSPADKKGALIEFLPAYRMDLQAANDGNGIIYGAFGQLGEGVVGHTAISHILSRRRGSGEWSSQDIALPDELPPEEVSPSELLGGGAEYRLSSPDLSEAVVEALKYSPPLAPEVTTECTVLYLRNNLTGGYTPLLTAEDVPPNTNLCQESVGNERMQVYAATPDFSHFVVWSPVALTAEQYTGELYEFDRSTGSIRPIGVLPDGKPFQGVEMALGGEGSGFGGAQRAMSADGRWVAWTPGNPYHNANVPLYVRDMVGEVTYRVGGNSARYQTMNSDGSMVFYLENGSLYLFDTNTPMAPALDLTPNYGSQGETSPGVREAVSDVSEDGTYVYFVATGVLSSNGNAMKAKAVFGSDDDNLYVSHFNGSAWEEPKFIATLSHEDEKSWYNESFGQLSAPALQYVSSRVSPNGRYIAFMSSNSLTGYDNIDVGSSPGAPHRDEEVYLYDADTGSLVCASCNPTGSRPSGVFDSSERGKSLLVDRAESWTKKEEGIVPGTDHWLAGSVPGWDEGQQRRSVYQPRYLSDSGRLFFNSPDALVPQATNGLEDVYEYEPAGVGSCINTSVTFSARSDGCVGLISSGISSSESAFFDASESGDDAFFITSAKLVRADFDTTYDVYDAHVCTTAAPCPVESTEPPPCDSGDSCKGAPAPQPEIFGPPPSATFSGAGNVAPPVAKPAAPTKAQKLARALAACHRKHGRRARGSCERQARKRYSVKRASNASHARRAS